MTPKILLLFIITIFLVYSANVGFSLWKSESVVGEVHLLRDHQMISNQKTWRGIVGRFFANKPVVVADRLISNLFEKIDLNIIFFAGHPNERVGIKEKELLPWWSFPVFIIVLYLLIKKIKYTKLTPKTDPNFIICLLLIICLAAYLRFVGIADKSQGLYVDEASIAYNAKSIGLTLRDEYGQFLPLAFRSFGDFKPPLLEYLSIPWVSIFGEVSGVKYFSATLGILTVLLIGLVAKRIFKRTDIGLVSALSLAINPWHVNLSRHAIEAVLSTFLISLALFLFIHSKIRSSLCILALSTFAYHSARFLSPILAVIFFFIYFKNNKPKLNLGWLSLALSWIFCLIILVQPFTLARASGVSVFNSYHGLQLIRHLLSSYVSYFSPRVLALGDWQPRNNIFAINNIWLWTLASFYFGLIFYIRRRSLILLLLLISPLPAAAAIDPFHAIRSLTMVMPLSIFSGLGIVLFVDVIKNALLKKTAIIFFVILVIFQSLLLTERLTVQNPITAYDQWNTGYQDLVEKLMALDTSSYREIIVDNTDEPAIYSLWQVFGGVSVNQKIPLYHNYYQPIKWATPETLILKTGQRVVFRNIYWPKDQLNVDVLYVGSKKRFDSDALVRSDAHIYYEGRDQRGEVKWMIVSTPHTLPKSKN